MNDLTREPDSLLTAQETAEAANLSKQTVLNYVKEGIIKPTLRLSNGQCFFDEEAVARLLVLAFSKDYKNNTLAVCLGSPEMHQSFKEEYGRYLNGQGIQRVDNLAEYLMGCRGKLRLNTLAQRVCVTQAVETTVRACEKEVNKLAKDLQNYILFHSDIEDVSVFAEHRDNLLDAESISPKLSRNDRKIYHRGIDMYRRKRESVEERYAFEDMHNLIKALNSPQWERVMGYQPEKPVVRAIWRKVEQRHLHDCIKSHLKEYFKQGYVSVLCLDMQSDRCIYELISKSMNPCISRIEVYCMDDITQEIQQTFEGIQEYKDVIFKSEI